MSKRYVDKEGVKHFWGIIDARKADKACAMYIPNPRLSTWKGIQQLVRAGQAEKYFNVGDQLTCSKIRSDGTSEVLVWDIIGIDHDTPSDPQFTHSMTLQLHELYQNMQFDSPEAMYYCENKLAAGTYNFVLLEGYDTEHGGGKPYTFTLTSPIPAGGQIFFNWGYNTQANTCKIITYADNMTAAALETVSVIEGANGTPLGTADGKSAAMNHVHRFRYGSNKWSESDLRMRLNSAAAPGGNIWNAKNNFSHNPSWTVSDGGFLYGIDADFLAVLGNVKKTTVLNTITDGRGSETLDEKIFLLSRSEIFAGKENNADEGSPYPYYKNYSDHANENSSNDKNRIKYNSENVPYYWWLRSPNTGSAGNVCSIKPSGNLSNNGASDRFGIAPACCII